MIVEVVNEVGIHAVSNIVSVPVACLTEVNVVGSQCHVGLNIEHAMRACVEAQLQSTMHLVGCCHAGGTTQSGSVEAHAHHGAHLQQARGVVAVQIGRDVEQVVKLSAYTQIHTVVVLLIAQCSIDQQAQ